MCRDEGVYQGKGACPPVRTGLGVRSEAPRLPRGTQKDLTVHSPCLALIPPPELLIHWRDRYRGLTWVRPVSHLFYPAGSSPATPPILQRKKLRLRQSKAFARGPTRFQPGHGDSRRPHTDPSHHPARAGRRGAWL